MNSSDNPADIVTRFNDYSLKKNPYLEEVSINENDGNVYLEKLRGDIPDVISKYYYEELQVTSSNLSLVCKNERLNEVICIT